MVKEPDRFARSAPRDSAMMLAALAVLAYAASMMTHEALGHGVYCLAVGGHNTMLTGWGEWCRGPVGLGLKAAGPGVQFGAGLLAWWVLRRLPVGACRLRFFVWLLMVFDLLIASGYVAFGGITGIGDAADMVAGLRPGFAWRGGMILLGSAIYYLCMLAAASELGRFAGDDWGGGRLFRLMWIPYVAVGVFASSTGALNHTMGHGVALGFAVASSFGAATGLLFLPLIHREMFRPAESAAAYVSWSTGWGVLAAAVVASFVVFLGPGLR